MTDPVDDCARPGAITAINPEPNRIAPILTAFIKALDTYDLKTLAIQANCEIVKRERAMQTLQDEGQLCDKRIHNQL